MSKYVKIGIICGSLRKNSRNKSLCESAIRYNSNDNIELEIIDISKLPLFNEDLELLVEGKYSFPPEIAKFRERVNKCQGLLLVSPEYNYSMSSPMKNAIDWLSRGNELSKSPLFSLTIGFMSAGYSTGGAKACQAMSDIFQQMNWLHITTIDNWVNVKLAESETIFDSYNNVVSKIVINQIQDLIDNIYEHI